MAFVAVHIVVPMILAELYHKMRGKAVMLAVLFFAGIGGIAPDFDFGFALLGQILGVEVTNPFFLHGGITHTPFVIGLTTIFSLFLWKFWRKEWGVYGFAFAFGMSVHLILDAFIGGGSQGGLFWLFPLSLKIFEAPLHTSPNLLFMEMIDAIFMLGWIIYMFWRGNIKSTI